jgi:GNAT superfamily N-acetyltransferase
MAVLYGYVTSAGVAWTLCFLVQISTRWATPSSGSVRTRPQKKRFRPDYSFSGPHVLGIGLRTLDPQRQCIDVSYSKRSMQSLRIVVTWSVELTGANIRDAQLPEIGLLAKLWFDGWQDAHARIVPAELARVRTMPSFEDRLRRASTRLRVAVVTGAPVGFYILKGDELYQFYVSSSARGSGVAAVLMADAETHLREKGVDTAWLACAVGNDRAARFYEKCGWIRTATVSDDVEVPDGTFPLDVWRYEKSLR